MTPSRRLAVRVLRALACGACWLGLAACGDADGDTDGDTPEPAAPPAAPAPIDRFEVMPDSATATALGQSVAVTVTQRRGQTASPVFSLRDERRWLDDHSVLEAASLANGRLVARAPGRAVVNISAGGDTDSVIVNVIPSQVTVMESRLPGGRTQLGDGDTIVLRGFRLNQLTAASVNAGTVTVTIAGADSATARLVVPTLSATGCGGAALFGIAFTGAQGAPIAGLSQKRTGELTLAVGEARRLTQADAACVRLPYTGSARYLVAYADTRLVTKAQTMPEWPWPDSILIAGADRSNTVPASMSATELAEHSARIARRVPAAASATGLRAHIDADVAPDYEWERPIALALPPVARVVAGCPFNNSFLAYCRTTPYAAGDEFMFYPAGSQRPADASRVLAVRGSLVAAVFRPDSSMLPPGTTARVDSALNVMRLRGVPLLQYIFSLAAPTRTTDESGQVLISLEQITGTTAAFANWYPDPATSHGRWGKVTLGITPLSAIGDPTSNPTRILGIAAHEVLHTYQFRWRYEYGSPWRTYLGTGWGVEGAASFFGMEMLREQLGIGFLTNLVVGGVASTSPLLSMTQYTARVTDLTRGYESAASFLRDLVQRLVEDAGVPFDDAMREVIVGALEGWHGINDEGLARGLGLTARMRQRLGTSWSPANALLDWTMSQAADDQTSNPRYQNRTVRLPATSTNLIIVPGGTLGTGSTIGVLRAPGNTGVLRIDDVRGGSYSFTATVRGTATDAVEWLILRIN